MPKKRLEIPPMPPEHLGRFVDDYCSGRLFTSNRCTNPNDLRYVFMPLGLMDFTEYERADLENVALIWEYMSEATPRTINGMPTFATCRLMSEKDWMTLSPLIQKELDHRVMLRERITQPKPTKSRKPKRRK